MAVPELGCVLCVHDGGARGAEPSGAVTAAILERYGGEVLAAASPTVAARFASVSSAVEAAVTLQRRGGGALGIGVAAGDLPAGAADETACAVTRDAAALARRAEPGCICTTAAVPLLLESAHPLRFVETGRIRTSAQASTQPLWTLEWATPPGPLGTTMPVPAVLDPDASLPFVARTEATAKLETAWAAAIDGRRQAVFVSGEAGAGKSRLVGEFARSVHDRGALVMAGTCSPDLDVPYQPFIEALGSLFEPLAVEQRRELAGAGIADLALLLPRLALADPRDRLAPAEDPASGRYWLFEAIVDLLARLSRTAPVLVVLEDLHWARSSTALLVDHLLNERRLTQVCLVATMRSSTQDLSDATSGVLADLPRRPAVDRLTLDGLGTEQVTELVGRLVGHRLDEPLEQLARHLSELTAGNPFLIGEQWRQLVEEGRVQRRDRRWEVSGPPAVAASPATVRELINRTVSRIGEDAQRLLPVAAVAGVSFDTMVVARAAGLEIDRTLRVLEQALSAELVVVDGPSRFRFRHALVGQALAEGLGPAARRHAHLSLAWAIEALGPDRLDELVHHYVAAIPLVAESEATDRARRAARRALATHHYHQAAGPLQEALAAVTDPARRADLLLDLAEVTAWSGDLDISVPAAAEAASIARELDDDVRLVQAALALQQICVGAPEVLVESSDLVRDALAVVRDDVARARLLGTLSTVLAFQGRDPEAVVAADQALAAARDCADDVTVAEIMHACLYAGWLEPGRLERQLALCREGEERARRAGNDTALLRMLIKKGFGLNAVGDGGQLRHQLPEQRRLIRRVRQPVLLAVDAAMQGIEALSCGRVQDAERLAEEFESWSQRVSHPLEGYGVMMFTIRREQGRLAELRPLVEMISRLGQEDASWWPGLAALYAELGMAEDARRVLDRLAAQPSIGTGDILQPVTLSYVADAAAITGHPIAAEAYRGLEPWAGRAVSSAALACYGSADRYLGRLAEACGRHSAARRHYEVAVRFDEAAGWSLWSAHSKLALGGHLLRSGGRADHDRGMTLVTEARHVATTSGVTALADRCAIAVRSTDADTEDRPAAATPSSPVPTALTTREKEILRLIADGRTNREVGELLHTSQHTVANQVHGILVKSGCANRAEAIAWAHSHHLLD